MQARLSVRAEEAQSILSDLQGFAPPRRDPRLWLSVYPAPPPTIDGGEILSRGSTRKIHFGRAREAGAKASFETGNGDADHRDAPIPAPRPRRRLSRWSRLRGKTGAANTRLASHPDGGTRHRRPAFERNRIEQPR
jgi:hypothetical protein